MDNGRKEEENENCVMLQFQCLDTISRQHFWAVCHKKVISVSIQTDACLVKHCPAMLYYTRIT